MYRFRKQGRVFLLVVFLAACAINNLTAAPAVESAGSGPRAVTDLRGRVVSIPEQLDGILALGAGSLRLLSYFDAIDRVIAVEDSGHGREKSVHQFFHLAGYRAAHPGLRDLPSIGDSANHEAIITAAPDIIFVSMTDPSRADHLQAITGIPVFAIDADVELSDMERFTTQLLVFGEVLGEERRALEIIHGLEAYLADIQARRLLVAEKPDVYVGGMMFYGPANLLRTTGDFIPFDFSGGRNVMPTNPSGNLQPYMTSIEDLVAARPQHVFIDAANAALSKEGYQAHRELLDENVPAFTKRNVHVTLVYKYYGTNWENQLINVYSVGKTLFPDLYADIVIEDLAREIWEFFFQVPVSYQDMIADYASVPGIVDWW